ncbi:hypothetical protein LTR17_008709 [Elasticomyces elasticus]|nr:hypothetical protein LTR17_008709 [Elasticomyces elasticus]
MLPPSIIRRLSDPPRSTATSDVRRRSSSMTDFQHLKGRLKLRPFTAKALPADPAITACSVRVAEAPRLNTVYEHPGPLYIAATHDKKATKTAQTVSCGSSTYQLVWEEPPSTQGSESDTTLMEDIDADEEGSQGSMTVNVDRSPSPMGKAREQQEDDEDSDGGSRLKLPIMLVETHDRRAESEDRPYGPPNTEKPSASSSAKHSRTQTPRGIKFALDDEEDELEQADDDDILNSDKRVQEATSDEGHEADDEDIGDIDDEPEAEQDDDEEEQPVELRFKSAFHKLRSLSMPSTTDFLTIPENAQHNSSSPMGDRAGSSIPRLLSNLSAEDKRFTRHRDSLDLNHDRIEREARMNQLLMTTQDSFVMAKLKYESKYPHSTGQFSRFGGLSPIADASPPDAGRSIGAAGMAQVSKRLEKAVEDPPKKHDGHIHWAGQHEVVVKPKWYKAKYMKGEGGAMTLKFFDEEASE